MPELYSWHLYCIFCFNHVCLNGLMHLSFSFWKWLILHSISLFIMIAYSHGIDLIFVLFFPVIFAEISPSIWRKQLLCYCNICNFKMLRHTWACRCKEAYGIKVWKRIYLSGTWTTPWLWCKSLGKFLYLHDVEYDHVEDHFVPVFFFLSNLVLSLQLVEKLSAKAADGPIKRKILSTIAEEHNIKWEPKSFGDNDTKTSQDLLVWFFYGLNM